MKFPRIIFYFLGVFEISNNQLILSQSLDYETEPVVIIQVESTDNGIPPLSVQVCLIKSLHKKTKFSIKDFFSKCDQIRSKLQIWSHLLKKSLMENFIFCAVKFNGKNVLSSNNLAFPF